MNVRIALIHALSHSVAPINHDLHTHWPQARVMNLLDDSLSADLAQSVDGLNAAMTQRFSDAVRLRGGYGCPRHLVYLFGIRPVHRCRGPTSCTHARA
jgi:hypothetical protein